MSSAADGEALPIATEALPRGRRWASAAGRYGWLLIDQAAFAVTNLIINLLFAHWLTPLEYGRFAITFSGYILLSVLHWYVVVEPLLVESARIRAEQVRAYMLTLIRLHVAMLVAATGVSVVAVVVLAGFGAVETGQGIAASVGCGCAMLTLATARRLCLAFLSAMVSAIVGALYLVAAVATAWALYAAGAASWITLWFVMSGWSLVGAALICALLLRIPGPSSGYTLRDLLRATSRYSSWGSVTACFSWIRSDGIYAVLALSSGLPAVALTRAIVMLNAPVWQVNSALSASWLIDFGRCRRNGHELRSLLMRRTAAYLGVSAAALIGGFALAGPVTHLAYAGKYDHGAWLVPLFMLAFLLNGIEGMVTSAMKASGVFRDSYLPQIVGSTAVGAVAVVLTPLAGPAGAALAVVAGALCGLAAALALFLRRVPAHG